MMYKIRQVELHFNWISIYVLFYNKRCLCFFLILIHLVFSYIILENI